MKNLLSLAVIVAATFFLAGCASGSKYVVEGSGDQLVDLHNGAARQTLRDTQKKGEEIANLKVYTSCDEDMMILANYLMYGRCSA